MLSNAVGASLRHYGYRILPGSSNDVRFHIRITSGSDFRSQLILYHEKTDIAVLTVFLTDLQYPVSKQSQVYELADLINEKIVIGSLVTRLDDGCIYFRNSFDGREIELAAESFTRFLSASAFPVALWERAYEKLLNGRGWPTDCLNAALIELDANDSKIVSRGTRRAILKVERGELKDMPVLDSDTDMSLSTLLTELRLL